MPPSARWLCQVLAVAGAGRDLPTLLLLLAVGDAVVRAAAAEALGQVAARVERGAADALPESLWSALRGAVDLGFGLFPKYRLFLIAIGFGTCLALAGWLKFTRVGMHTRAVSQQPHVARMMGVNTDRLSLLVPVHIIELDVRDLGVDVAITPGKAASRRSSDRAMIRSASALASGPSTIPVRISSARASWLAASPSGLSRQPSAARWPCNARANWPASSAQSAVRPTRSAIPAETGR